MGGRRVHSARSHGRGDLDRDLVVAHTAVAKALGNAALSPVLVFYAPFPFLAFVAAVMPAALIAARRATLAAVLNAASGALTLVCVVTAALIAPDAQHMAVGLVVGQFVATLISTFAVYRAVGISIHRERVVSGSLALLRYGFPLALTGLAGMFAFQFDRLVVSREFLPCALRRIRDRRGGAAAFGHCPAGC